MTNHPNSVKLHETTGFQLVGTYHNTGYKAGKWCDLLLYEKSLGTYEERPKPIVAFHQFNRNELASIIKKYEVMVKQ